MQGTYNLRSLFMRSHAPLICANPVICLSSRGVGEGFLAGDVRMMLPDQLPPSGFDFRNHLRWGPVLKCGKPLPRGSRGVAVPRKTDPNSGREAEKLVGASQEPDFSSVKIMIRFYVASCDREQSSEEIFKRGRVMSEGAPELARIHFKIIDTQARLVE